MTIMRQRLIIGQINARRSPPVMEILEWGFNEQKFDVLLIQETPLALVRWEWSIPQYRIYVAFQTPNSHYGACFSCVECGGLGR